jgi:hypothetical protein
MALDPRVTPYRADLAADVLRDTVHAPRYAAARRFEVASPVLALREAPQPDAAQTTQALMGERVDIYDDIEGWAWGQLADDRYVGWMASDGLRPPQSPPTHKLAAMRSFLYPGPSIKLPPLGAVPFGAKLLVQDIAGPFARTIDGFVWLKHLVPTDVFDEDWVEVAERFLRVPYLWGGKTPLGLDCSGLVQVAFGATGLAVPRDSDMMQRDLGAPIDVASVRRGDLVFWRGHVGLMRDAETLLHANGDAMAVTAEPLTVARARILAAGGGAVTAVKRV